MEKPKDEPKPARALTPEKPNLEREVAESLVVAVLSISPRVDTFSTWLIGITSGFLVLIFSNIDKIIATFKVGSTKAVIAVLTTSILLGLIQKNIAFHLRIQTDIKKAMDRKIRELASTYGGEQATNPYLYLRDHIDVVKMIVLFPSAFPKWVRVKIIEMVVAERPPDLRALQNESKRVLWQFGFVALQLLCTVAAVFIAFLSF